MSDLKTNYIQENINSRFKMQDRDLWWDEHWFIINKDKICFDIQPHFKTFWRSSGRVPIMLFTWDWSFSTVLSGKDKFPPSAAAYGEEVKGLWYEKGHTYQTCS